MGALHETDPQYMGEWVSAMSAEGVLMVTPGSTTLRGRRGKGG